MEMNIEMGTKMQNIIPNAEERGQIHQMLKDLPENQAIFRCQSCKTVFNIYSQGLTIFMALANRDNVICPNCNTHSAELLCKVDSYSLWLKLIGFKCRDSTIISGTDLCPVCNRPVCPECYNHNVLSLSRVTGYIQDVSGWNEAKKQELIDRKRYSLDTN